MYGVMMSRFLIEDREKYNKGYYNEKLKIGLEFQDRVTMELYKRGIVLVGYSSNKYQNEYGENILGAEIKRDGMFRETGNLYIEIAEKSHPDKENFTPSGIYRDDNSWLFIIGDENTFYIFVNKYLRWLEKKYQKKIKTTSKGFLMPLKDADKYCIRKIQIKR